VPFLISIILILIRNRFYQGDGEGILFDYESPGTSIRRTDRMLVEVEKSYTSYPGNGYSRRTGTQMGFITEPNRAII
jgi:hypothetical protein